MLWNAAQEPRWNEITKLMTKINISVFRCTENEMNERVYLKSVKITPLSIETILHEWALNSQGKEKKKKAYENLALENLNSTFNGCSPVLCFKVHLLFIFSISNLWNLCPPCLSRTVLPDIQNSSSACIIWGQNTQPVCDVLKTSASGLQRFHVSEYYPDIFWS